MTMIRFINWAMFVTLVTMALIAFYFNNPPAIPVTVLPVTSISSLSDKIKINQTLEFYPQLVTDSNKTEIFRINQDGKIYLRGKLIGKDKEVAKIFSDYARKWDHLSQ